ncbi:hypothetical protein DM01DRAFT_1408949 [Hesseltinella vesiculosa]|uniref:ER membrane protein complex subunit 7 beta-sandwich domain-containing protein n=1 Tax=Hesseltinella vesiculosa TaxID=101127 RepID=A0A1X2GD20_9FUNG|nr:hypothetical protein DM01DRAFT_1408949 [Hesseltinella vesiculosa]
MIGVFVYSILCVLMATAHAIRVEGNVATNGILADVRQLNPTTTVSLSGMHSTLILANGSFVFEQVPPGSYLLEVNSIDFIFSKLRVDVKEDGQVNGAYAGNGIGWDNTGYSVPYPFTFRARAHAEYFTEKQAFNMLAMFKNPMFLMIGFSAIMMFVMPKMMKNLDPEMMKELQDSQASTQNMMKEVPSLSQMFSQAQQQAKQRSQR